MWPKSDATTDGPREIAYAKRMHKKQAKLGDDQN